MAADRFLTRVLAGIRLARALRKIPVLGWLMEKFLDTLIATAMTPLARAIVGGIGPYLRTAETYGLQRATFGDVLGMVAARFQGPQTYAPLGPMTATETQDLVEGLYETVRALMTAYGVPLTAPQANRILAAVADRVLATATPA